MNEFFIKKAIQVAKQASKLGEVPVGALIVQDGKIISEAYNLRETQQRPTAHAELLAIEAASQKLKTWRLESCELYVTLEPCLMCWGSIILARIPKVVFGAYDTKAGVCGSVLSLHESQLFNHFPEVQGGVLAEQCGAILSDFFEGLRQEKKLRKGPAGI